MSLSVNVGNIQLQDGAKFWGRIPVTAQTLSYRKAAPQPQPGAGILTHYLTSTGHWSQGALAGVGVTHSDLSPLPLANQLQLQLARYGKWNQLAC